MQYQIEDILEADFGCEEREEGAPLLCCLVLSADGKRIYRKRRSCEGLRQEQRWEWIDHSEDRKIADRFPEPGLTGLRACRCGYEEKRSQRY